MCRGVDAPWRPLGISWGSFGGFLEASWGGPWGPIEASAGPLGASWGLLGACWRSRGLSSSPYWVPIGASGVVPGRSWEPLRPFVDGLKTETAMNFRQFFIPQVQRGVLVFSGHPAQEHRNTPTSSSPSSTTLSSPASRTHTDTHIINISIHSHSHTLTYTLIHSS